jgi:hypothetical protein
MTAVPYRGACANYICAQYGCQGQCGYRPPNYVPGYYQAATPRGCICPPGAEKTCQGFGCPRKGISAASVIETRSATTVGRGPQDESAVPEADAHD